MKSRPIGPPRRGYTYAELAIMVLIMGILAAAAVPTYTSVVTNYRVELAARRIVADLNYARAEAQRSSKTRSVQFDTLNNRYTLTNVNNIDRSGNAYVVNLVDDPFSSTLISASFGANAEVTFDMYGRPDDPGTVIVRSGTVQKTVDLAADGTASIP